MFEFFLKYISSLTSDWPAVFPLSATILKLLENEEDDGEQSEQQTKLLDHELFFSMLAEAAVRPFARGEEKTTPKTSIDKYDHKPFRPCLH